MTPRKKKWLYLFYALVLLCALVVLPSQLMQLIRDGWIFFNKEGYQAHVATVRKVEVRKKGRRGSTWKVVEAVLGKEKPVLLDDMTLTLSPYDFQSIPKPDDTVKVWINTSTAELAVGREPVARVGDWYFQQVTLGRVLRHALILAFFGWAGLTSLRRINRLAEGKA
ncbi:MAG TPA: hypothetical protein VLE43_18125 [Candidatus Saccharimonadia bacterium]|nr:hypothetical protein [Candidatus Saccharimonadia bacterium]